MSHWERWRPVYTLVGSESLAFLLPIIVTIILSLLVRSAFDRVVDEAKDDLGSNVAEVVSRLVEDFVASIFTFKNTVQQAVALGWFSGDTTESGSREWSSMISMPFHTMSESMALYQVLPGPSRKVIKLISDDSGATLGLEERIYVNASYQYRRKALMDVASPPLTISFGDDTVKSYDPWEKSWYKTAVAAEDQVWNGPVLSATAETRDEQIIELLFRAQWPAGTAHAGEYSAFKYKMRLEAVSRILKRLQNRLTRDSIVVVAKNDGKVLGLMWFGVESPIAFSSATLGNATDGSATDIDFKTISQFPYPLSLIADSFVAGLNFETRTLQLDDDYLVFAQRFNAGLLDWNVIAVVNEKNIIPGLNKFMSMLQAVLIVSVVVYTFRGCVSAVIVGFRIRSLIHTNQVIPSSRVVSMTNLASKRGLHNPPNPAIALSGSPHSFGSFAVGSDAAMDSSLSDGSPDPHNRDQAMLSHMTVASPNGSSAALV